jgi:dynein heavy chain
MNSVLDDNKLLCLANSERIKLTNTMHMIFEVGDLSVASPATISRVCILFILVRYGLCGSRASWLAALR